MAAAITCLQIVFGRSNLYCTICTFIVFISTSKKMSNSEMGFLNLTFLSLDYLLSTCCPVINRLLCTNEWNFYANNRVPWRCKCIMYRHTSAAIEFFIVACSFDFNVRADWLFDNIRIKRCWMVFKHYSNRENSKKYQSNRRKEMKVRPACV